MPLDLDANQGMESFLKRTAEKEGGNRGVRG
jgi:hypothetical protein